MTYDPQLLDELARIYAQAALAELLRDRDRITESNSGAVAPENQPTDGSGTARITRAALHRPPKP